MPVRKVSKNGKTGYQWGKTGHVYTGPGAQKRAEAQGRAVYAAGYRKKANGR